MTQNTKTARCDIHPTKPVPPSSVCADCVRRNMPVWPGQQWQYAPVFKDGVCPSRIGPVIEDVAGLNPALSTTRPI